MLNTGSSHFLGKNLAPFLWLIKMIDPNVPWCLFYAAHLHLQHSRVGRGGRDWFLYSKQALCAKHPIVTLYLCIVIKSQGLRENEVHWMKGDLGDFNKGIVYKRCEIEGNVQEACRVLCVASEWIQQGGDTQPEEGTSGQKRRERDRQNGCSHTRGWRLTLSGQTRCTIVLLLLLLLLSRFCRVRLCATP